MTANRTRNELERLFVLLVQEEVALTMNPVVMRKVADGLRVTWRSSKDPQAGLSQAGFGTLDEYCAWLQAEAYSAILYDGSLLQMSYDFDGDEVLRHRLVYHPCPFDLDPQLLNDTPVLDVMNVYRFASSNEVRLRSPIRFDYDPASQNDGHPASHLTFLSESCRWAVVAPLSPGHFIRFIFRHFYPVFWRNLEFIRNWPQELGSRTITSSEEQLLHVACRR